MLSHRDSHISSESQSEMRFSMPVEQNQPLDSGELLCYSRPMADTEDTIEVGFLDLFGESDPDEPSIAESAISLFIEAEKKKAIAEAKREIIPVVIGTALASGVLGSVLFSFLSKK